MRPPSGPAVPLWRRSTAGAVPPSALPTGGSRRPGRAARRRGTGSPGRRKRSRTRCAFRRRRSPAVDTAPPSPGRTTWSPPGRNGLSGRGLPVHGACPRRRNPRPSGLPLPSSLPPIRPSASSAATPVPGRRRAGLRPPEWRRRRPGWPPGRDRTHNRCPKAPWRHGGAPRCGPAAERTVRPPA